jgi:orotate phosphoribosyltransferase
VETDEARAELRRLLLERTVRRGAVTLRSGATSTYYIDCRVLTLSPDGLALVARLMLESLPADIQAVGGPTLGADPIAAGICLLSGQVGRPLPAFIVRKEAKEHGRGQRIEGPVEAGLRVAVVEDTVTTGGALQGAIAAVEEAGMVVGAVRCIVDRETGGLDALRARGYNAQALFGASDLGLADQKG